ncbi:glycosyltransferase family 2 protein [Inediibacterium massiliense]|uniref:glycosyltransferase family 2 protein n=1 Tax=Inediibacterium massiliense TaxID=1658111 RepID=UPI0006B5E372|nr:glycosyltransferase family 2 protein [Inediibacterium massiliense]
MSQWITALVPTYNEEDKIKETIEGIQKCQYIDKIVIVDDGSIDQTVNVVKDTKAEVYSLHKNQGKGAALTYGIQKVIDESKIIIFLDGDLGASSMEADKLVLPILEGTADVTIARFPSAKKKGGFGLVKNLARYGVKHYTGHTIYTSLSGQRAFKSEVLKKLGPIPSDYGVEVGMTIDILNMGYKIKEVDVTMTHRETGRDLKGFIHRGKQFHQILSTLLKKNKEVKK